MVLNLTYAFSFQLLLWSQLRFLGWRLALLALALGLGLDLGDTSIYDLFTNTTYPYSLPLPNQQGAYPYTSAATPSGYTASTFTFPPSEFIPKQDGYNLDLYY